MPLPYSLDLVRLSAAYASGALTPSQVVRDVRTQVQATQGNPVWLDVVSSDALAARASEVEHRRAQGEHLPLYGVPFAVKDNIDVAGLPTTAACPEFAYVATASAHA